LNAFTTKQQRLSQKQNEFIDVFTMIVIAGPNSSDASPPLPLLRQKNGKALIYLRKWRYWRSKRGLGNLRAAWTCNMAHINIFVDQIKNTTSLQNETPW